MDLQREGKESMLGISHSTSMPLQTRQILHLRPSQRSNLIMTRRRKI
jgi:hypothetical protein